MTRYDPKNPSWDERHPFVFGCIALAVFFAAVAIMAYVVGWFVSPK